MQDTEQPVGFRQRRSKPTADALLETLRSPFVASSWLLNERRPAPKGVLLALAPQSAPGRQLAAQTLCERRNCSLLLP